MRDEDRSGDVAIGICILACLVLVAAAAVMAGSRWLDRHDCACEPRHEVPACTR